ncbi:sigma-70 family RNA polymerase sigma factor [Paenibacillus apiarius]|uniref:sigma-70 family RNA polymerase sigma factor n=1 Tax=Paenibacillus apiarius TaxID=46240 RepID=UPI00197ED747|nr:sigma-70 family RNA polymerase sigma factor [Paenibacillus apiarius]MBN3524173.1 sigma-70 family RNA polymerase sigma factor [Paenibacillus apiarius]
MKESDLKPWLIRMSQGDAEAFQYVYRSTRDHAYRLIYFLAPYKQDAGDIMSEVYLELFRSLSKYDAEQPFQAWFNGLIVRQVRSWKRSAWRRFRLLERVATGFDAPRHNDMEEHVLALSDQLEVMPAVEKLSQKLKEVIVLRYYQDCSMEDIAVILQIPAGTVKSRHHLALKRLRHLLEVRNAGKESSTYVNGNKTEA